MYIYIVPLYTEKRPFFAENKSLSCDLWFHDAQKNRFMPKNRQQIFRSRPRNGRISIKQLELVLWEE